MKNQTNHKEYIKKKTTYTSYKSSNLYGHYRSQRIHMDSHEKRNQY